MFIRPRNTLDPKTKSDFEMFPQDGRKTQTNSNLITSVAFA